MYHYISERTTSLELLLQKAIEASPLLSSASDILIRDQVPLIRLFNGESLFSQSDAGGCAFLVLEGVVGLYHYDKRRISRLFKRAVIGSLIGELSALAELPRSASAIALTGAIVAEISPEMMQHCISKSSTFSSALIRSLSHSASAGRRPLEGDPPKIIILEISCRKYGIHTVEKICAYINDSSTVRIVDKRHLQWPSELQIPALSLALQEKNQTIFIVDPSFSLNPMAAKLVDLYITITDNTMINAQRADIVYDIVRVWPDSKGNPVNDFDHAILSNVRQIYNLRANNRRDIGRVVRNILGTGNALVLGGGGAKGFAHVGILKALYDRGIDDIDVVYGVSIGAFVGSLYALEAGWEDIYSNMVSIFAKGTAYTLSLPVHSIFSYGKDIKRIRSLLEGIDVSSTWIPFVPCSVDITNYEMRYWRFGSMFDCVLASMSIPGLAPPVRMKDGSFNVDGCVLNNLPVAHARSAHRGRLVAVSLEKGFGPPDPISSSKSKLLNLLASARIANAELPLVSDVMTHSLLCTTRKRFRDEADYSDVFIEPETSGYGILDWRYYREIMEAGYIEGMRAEI